MENVFKKDRQCSKRPALHIRRKRLPEEHHYDIRNRHSEWIIVMLLLSSVICFTVSSDADMVYGIVKENNVPKKITQKNNEAGFSVLNSNGEVVIENVYTNDNGEYNIFLPMTGRYTVNYKGKTATIFSHPEPMRQDIEIR